MQETLVEQPKEGKVLSKYSREEIREATLEYFGGDEIATDVWINKYCLKDSEGNLYEKTPDDMHWRLAKELARIELKYPNPLFAEEIYEKIKNFKKIVPQGSPMAGIGNDFQTVSISNCLRGETKVLTRKGYKEIKTLKNSIQKIMTKGGGWVDAPFKSYGKQNLYKIKLKKGKTGNKEIFCTEDHDWFIKRPTNKTKLIKIPTLELKIGDKLHNQYGKGYGSTKPSPFGIAHGITFGDGNIQKNNDFANSIVLCGDSRELSKYFINEKISTDELLCDGGSDRYGSLPNYYREKPNILENRSYLYGWLSGYFAADGNIDERGSTAIHSANKNNIEFILDVCGVLGIGCSEIQNQTVISNLTNEEHTMYKCFLHTNHLSEEFFLLDKHKTRFKKTNKTPSKWEVVEVIKTEEFEEVYCAEVPNTLSFVIDNNILTGNCFVIGNEKDADSYGGIFKLDQEIAQLQKRRAGVGVDLSFIRPKGSQVKNSALTSTGIVPFMERFSNTTREVAQDGRRGALMESISIKHPDAEEFIDAKMVNGKVTGANVSIKLDNAFMKAATQGTTYTQQYPIDAAIPKITKEVNASKIWKKIIHNAWAKAEPGILFWDTLIEESIPDCYDDLGFKSISTNPCLTLDSNIMTDKGNKTVEELIGVKFIAMVDGGFYSSTDKGFFITGENRDVFQITTKKGFKIKSTDNHEFKQVLEINRNDKKYKWTQLKNFQIGDTINLNNNIGMNWNGEGNFEEGWLIGSLLGDGTFDNESAILRYWGEDRKETKNYAIECIKNNLKYRLDLGNSKDDLEIEQVKSVNLKKLSYEYGVLNDKRINNKIEKASSKFYKGFLCGWFDADGTVNNNIEKGVNVRLASSILENLYVAQRMLSKIGIISTVYENRREEQYKKMPDGNGGYKMYKTKSQHELSISKDNLLIFQEEINFIENSKKNKLKNALNNLDRGLYRERFVDTIKSIEYVGVENVYDCQIPDKNEFDANGISTHNCGEIPLCANDSCRLLAINLFGYVVNPFTDGAYFDWELFKIDVRIAEKLMDDIIDLELEKIDKIITKIDSDPEDVEIRKTERQLWVNIKDKAERGRRTGLGITAEGDMLAALGFIYGTDEANLFAEEVHKQLKLEAYRSSVWMARDRGAFPMYDAEREIYNPFILRIKDEDVDLYFDMIKYGRRNLALLTIAPTGTVSIMTQTSSGIEPVFLVSYMRRRKINPNDKNVRVDFTDELGDTWMEYPVFHHKFIVWLEVNGYDVKDITENYTGEQINELVEKSPYHGATSNDVDWVKKVEMQGMVQKHIDHSISTTINLPNEVTEETVSKVYEAGWKYKCKGLTVYRDGSRSGVLVSDSEKKKQEKDQLFKDNHAPKRPKRLKAEIIRFQNNLEKWIGVVGMMDGRPYEVFTGRMKNGLSQLPTTLNECEIVKIRDENGEKRYDIEYIDSDGNKETHTGLNHTFNEEYWNYAKLISSMLRHGMPLIYVLDLIQSLNLDDEHLNTWKNGVARVIKTFIKNGEKGKGNCPQCNSKEFIYQEGCLRCVECSWSKCG